MQIRDGLIGKPRGRKDRTGVVIEELEPMSDIGGVIAAGLV